VGQAAVFLDRDGVLNRSEVRDRKPYAPRRLEDFRLLPNAARSVARLKQAGFRVIVVTNQPDIGNGLVGREVVEAMHERLQARVPVDAVRMCPHSQTAGCDCRKPKPGLLLQAAIEFDIDLPRSFMVGDRASDISAANNAGCKSVFVNRGYAETPPKYADGEVTCLAGAVRFIVNSSSIEANLLRDDGHSFNPRRSGDQW